MPFDLILRASKTGGLEVVRSTQVTLGDSQAAALDAVTVLAGSFRAGAQL